MVHGPFRGVRPWTGSELMLHGPANGPGFYTLQPHSDPDRTRIGLGETLLLDMDVKIILTKA